MTNSALGNVSLEGMLCADVLDKLVSTQPFAFRSLVFGRHVQQQTSPSLTRGESGRLFDRLSAGRRVALSLAFPPTLVACHTRACIYGIHTYALISSGNSSVSKSATHYPLRSAQQAGAHGPLARNTLPLMTIMIGISFTYALIVWLCKEGEGVVIR